jgi:hypothetical protein
MLRIFRRTAVWHFEPCWHVLTCALWQHFCAVMVNFGTKGKVKIEGKSPLDIAGSNKDIVHTHCLLLLWQTSCRCRHHDIISGLFRFLTCCRKSCGHTPQKTLAKSERRKNYVEPFVGPRCALRECPRSFPSFSLRFPLSPPWLPGSVGTGTGKWSSSSVGCDQPLAAA